MAVNKAYDYSDTKTIGCLGPLLVALKRIVVGLLLVAGSVYALVWNEGHAVQKARDQENAAAVHAEAPLEQVDAAHGQKLAHVTGGANAGTKRIDIDDPGLIWGIRGGGWLVMAFGIYLFFVPFVKVTAALPILGDILGLGLAVYSFVLAFFGSSMTIAAVWYFYRPALAAALIVGGLISLIVAKKIGGPIQARKREILAGSDNIGKIAK